MRRGNGARVRRFGAGCGLAALLVLPGLAAAQSAAPTEGVPPTDLTKLSLEDLMRIQVEPVFGAEKRVQPATEAPSSVTIVTADDIAKYGYRTLADVLRGVRGFYVTDDRNYSYVGVRGFDRPGDYNTRVLLLIDGHRVNDDVFDQAPIGAELGLDLSTFDRVEIIRGPSSALYGTSAFFAVINVTTKRASDLKRSTAAAQGGDLGSARGDAIAGHTWKNGVDAVLSGHAEHANGYGSLYFPEFDSPDTNNGVAEHSDAEDVRGATARITDGNLTISGAAGWRKKQVPTASFGTLFNDPRFHTLDRRAWVDASYGRKWHGADITTHTYADWYAYDGTYPYAPQSGDGPAVISTDYGHGVWWGADARATRPMPGHETVTLGVEYRDNARQNQGEQYADNRLPAWYTNIGTQAFAAYVQDEVRLRDRLVLGGAARYDDYEGFDQITPRASVVFEPTPQRSFKYLFGTAFRAPNAYEFDYNTAGIRNTALRPETLTSHELVWEEYRGAVRASVSGYWNNTKDLLTLVEIDGPDDLGFVNIQRVRAEGAEFEVEARLAHGVEGTFSYSRQRAYDRDTGAPLTNSPRQLAKARVSVQGPASRSTLALEVLGMSSRLTLGGDSVGANVVANVTYRQALNQRLDISASMRNLFNATYADPASDEHVQDAIVQDGRTFWAGIGVNWNEK